MDISKLKTGEIADLLDKGKLIFNPLVGKYRCGTTISGKYIYKQENAYFCAGSSVTMNWAGYNWVLIGVFNEKKELRGYDAHAYGTYDDKTNLTKVPDKIKKRAYKHLMFLKNHFTSDYIDKIKDYQLRQPMLLEVSK